MVEDFLIADIQTLPPATDMNQISVFNEPHDFFCEAEPDVIHEPVSETKQVQKSSFKCLYMYLYFVSQFSYTYFPSFPKTSLFCFFFLTFLSLYFPSLCDDSVAKTAATREDFWWWVHFLGELSSKKWSFQDSSNLQITYNF